MVETKKNGYEEMLWDCDGTTSEQIMAVLQRLEAFEASSEIS